ncbi:hypothetical protein LCGC14_0523080 [marine sediment metagenome]|uniref:Tail sheath protein subtilisin-like domain-containing protein n=1 Tax=marine sediment metagenome TaxID=412755 RepID=A0A0F9SGA6_9ZZZZ
MGANFPGAGNETPSVTTEIVTVSRGASVPGGIRLAAIVGEGQRVERIVSSARGSGNDGLDSDGTTVGDSDGRHFKLTFVPITSNRLDLFKNGILLNGLEQSGFLLAGGTFSSTFGYRYDLDGNIELQAAALVDQGGADFTTGTANVGNGTIGSLSLVDANAPSEVWTVRVSSVLRDGYGDPIDGYAIFVVSGSVSGVILDGYGSQITWQSNGIAVSNSILSFSITEGATTFVEGDSFTIEVTSGSLSAGDSLVAHYIATADLNDPEFFTDFDELQTKHGAASTDNRLSLGAQLAFSNGPPGIFAVQAAPGIPRRQSYVVEESASGGAVRDDLQFALPVGVLPDFDTNINFFITDPVTNTESQIIPNKVDFFDAAITASPDLFHFGAGYVFSYTVVQDDSVQKEGDDGVITSTGPTSATISSTVVNFGQDDINGTRTLQILAPAVNAGTYAIVSAADGILTLSDPGGFTDETAAEFRIIDSADSSSKILFTDDLALTASAILRVTVVDSKDADFFDVNWLSAYEALETVNCDIVVPLPSQTISAIFQVGRIHVDTMSNLKNKRERMLFIGAINGLLPGNVIGDTPAAVEDIGVLEGIQGDTVAEILAGNVEDLTDYGVQNSFGTTFRVVFFYPDQIIVQIGADRTILDGFFLAAAAAGFLTGIPNVAIPLTNKTMAGFAILRDRLFRPIIRENIAAAGITLVEPAIGGGTVVWGKTTTTSGFAEEEEISIVFIRDRIAKSMRAGFRGFIGTAESQTTQGSLMARAQGLMQGFISQGLITNFTDLQVGRDSVEPRQWNIRVAVQPVFPVNWIYIRVAIGLL